MTMVPSSNMSVSQPRCSNFTSMYDTPFADNTYKIIQPHFSQVHILHCLFLFTSPELLDFTKSDWTPDRTPALWGRMHRGHGSEREPEENDSSAAWHEHKTQQVEIPHEDRPKKWYDFDDKRKTELEVMNVTLIITLDNGNL